MIRADQAPMVSATLVFLSGSTKSRPISHAHAVRIQMERDGRFSLAFRRVLNRVWVGGVDLCAEVEVPLVQAITSKAGR